MPIYLFIISTKFHCYNKTANNRKWLARSDLENVRLKNFILRDFLSIPLHDSKINTFVLYFYLSLIIIKFHTANKNLLNDNSSKTWQAPPKQNQKNTTAISLLTFNTAWIINDILSWTHRIFPFQVFSFAFKFSGIIACQRRDLVWFRKFVWLIRRPCYLCRNVVKNVLNRLIIAFIENLFRPR